MSEPTRHTAGAMRAMRRLCPWTNDEDMLRIGADIITRETQDGPLLAALEGVVRMIRNGFIAPEFNADELDATPLDSGEIAASGWDAACDAYSASKAFKDAVAAIAAAKGAA